MTCLSTSPPRSSFRKPAFPSPAQQDESRIHGHVQYSTVAYDSIPVCQIGSVWKELRARRSENTYCTVQYSTQLKRLLQQHQILQFIKFLLSARTSRGARNVMFSFTFVSDWQLLLYCTVKAADQCATVSFPDLEGPSMHHQFSLPVPSENKT